MATIKVSETGAYVNHEYIPIPLSVTGGISDVLYCPWCRDLFIQATVAGLGSGDSIDITLEGGLDGEGWDNLDVDVSAIDTNGTTLIRFRGALPPYVRVTVDTDQLTLANATIDLQAYIAVIS